MSSVQQEKKAEAGEGGDEQEVSSGLGIDPFEHRQLDYPLVMRTDMSKDMIRKVIYFTRLSLEHNGGDVSRAVKNLKQRLEKATEPQWNVVMGNDFVYKLWSHQENFVLLAIGKLGVLLWKN